ncbi:unnamed protein product [Cylicostephanus goldi]|uniref:Uncharacterized protein n=1 Tax=Cylicostephanus goldi TaxID=71465 RepID=A0A3P6QSK2_CYLGO|nr:unnamed protein product [Cylicostephanus goldi]
MTSLLAIKDGLNINCVDPLGRYGHTQLLLQIIRFNIIK